MSLRDVLNIEVTTVTRVPEQSITVPAAVFVITQEDIHRSGARSLAEALRLAPGLQVARINGGAWSIGSRGFADRLARSMLVMIDGRSVYSPLFAGTYWENQDTLLADVDRIEVIRGPGGTLWGANAVNGIINIITKPAADTQGTYLRAGGGSEDRAFGSFRYGGRTGSLNYRAYLKGLDHGPGFHADGNDYDGWHGIQAGFRGDWTHAGGRSLTLQGDIYDGRLGERPTTTSYTPPYRQSSNLDAPISGGNVLARVAGTSGSLRDFQLQMYYDHTSRDEIPVGEDRDTGNVDFQQTFRWRNRQVFTWGGGYRVTSGRIAAVATSDFVPERRTDNLFSAFAQDEIVLTPDRWRLTVGSKFEHNDYSGFEAQPTVRLLSTPNTFNTFWAAVTRAVRTPSRVETDYTTTSLVSPAMPTFVRLTPNPMFDSEKLVAYEVGYRMRPAAQLFAAVSAFYNDFRDTLSTDLLTPFGETDAEGTRLILPVQFRNGLHGNSHGVEIASDYRPLPWWRVTANYSFLDVAMTRNPDGRDVSQERRYEEGIPTHQIQAGLSFDVSRWSFDWLFRRIGDLPALSVPAYAASTIRAAWQPTREIELSIVGHDLFSDRHLEWPSDSGNVQIERGIFAQLVWRR